MCNRWWQAYRINFESSFARAFLLTSLLFKRGRDGNNEDGVYGFPRVNPRSVVESVLGMIHDLLEIPRSCDMTLYQKTRVVIILVTGIFLVI